MKVANGVKAAERQLLNNVSQATPPNVEDEWL